jgi:two-component system, OmpR family, lantibiotic biosynthesis sensor histidine kinase NisK/SpaK
VGKVKRVERLSLKGQVIVTLLLILFSSWLATVLTFGGMMLWGRLTGSSRFDLERQISQFTAQQGVQLLSVSDKGKVEQVLHGLPYQVVNDQGHILYGSIQTPILHSPTDLVQRMNTTEIHGRWVYIPQFTITRYFPVFDRNGGLHGALVVRYTANGFPTRPSAQGWMSFLSFLIPLLPFLYFCLFSYLFAKRFGKRINQSLQVLMKGAQRIQQQDLDFEIEPTGPNEIGQVLVAFENMRAALKDSLVRQWQMEEERRHMISSISHDLRTPLTIIQGHVESLLDGAMKRPERLERYLQTVMHNTKRVIQLIEDMQKVTEVEQPDFSLVPIPVNVRDYFLDWTRDVELLTSRAGIQLNVHFVDERHEGTNMVIDPERMSQILDNIVSNSIRFTPTGGVITVRAEIAEHTVTVEISDTGKGFSKVDLEHMFDRFYQGDTSRSEIGHSGLGLYTAKTLVEKHGGTITAGNNPDGGAYVRFTIREHDISKDKM